MERNLWIYWVKKPFPICQQIATLIFFPSWLLLRQMVAHARTVDRNKFPRRRLVRAKVNISCFHAAYGKHKSRRWEFFHSFDLEQERIRRKTENFFLWIHAESCELERRRNRARFCNIRWLSMMKLLHRSRFKSKQKYSDQILRLPIPCNQSLVTVGWSRSKRESEKHWMLMNGRWIDWNL